jgi:hypothetical protein
LISQVIYFFTKKHIVLYDKHRQTLPLVTNKFNERKFYFFNIALIWKYIPFKTSDKRKHRVMYFFMNLIKPRFIISMNWQSKRESLYKVWTSRHPNSKFIVVQHGSYVGGFVTDIPHRYAKCDVFLTWGDYFVTEFTKYNNKKKVQVVSFGNPVYNCFNREHYSYTTTISNKVLLLPTALNDENLSYLYALIEKLKEFNFELVLKAHGKQGNKEINQDGTFKYPNIQGVNQIKGALYPILQVNDYDFIISDHSSSLLDAIFFKNKVLYFDPNNNVKGYTTHYSQFLPNLFDEDFASLSKDRLHELLSLEKQEALFNDMIYLGNNEIDLK